MEQQQEQPYEPALKLPPVIGRIERGEKTPICVIMVGMAGSGKTTLLTQLQRSLEMDDEEEEERASSEPATAETGESSSLAQSKNQQQQQQQQQPHPLNQKHAIVSIWIRRLFSMPYDVSIDIRDTVDYKQVMRQHKLGPNGAIMTSLNLFATKFDQVMNILERRAYETKVPPAAVPASAATEAATKEKGSGKSKDDDNDDEDDEDDLRPMDYILVDTPGQIEAFTWSASGSIISESLASAFPTVLCFVVDTVRCASSPNTFMSNMLYACSMLYRTRLPLIVCFNKIDVVSHTFCLEWMKDYEAFQQALDDVSDAAGFYGSLTRSLSLVLDEFYSSFANAVGVSAVTGDGIDEFWQTVKKAASQDFALDYIDDIKHRIEEQQARKLATARYSVRRLQRDLEATEER